jgi:hypothetical protein
VCSVNISVIPVRAMQFVDYFWSQNSLWMAPGAETCSSLTFVMNCILLSVIKLVDMIVVTMRGASNTTAELTNQKCHSSVTLPIFYC